MSINGVATGQVVGQFIVGLVDGSDANDEPDLIGAQGTFEFTPSPNYVPVPQGEPNAFTLLKDTVVAVLDSQGYLCTPLPGSTGIIAPGKRGIRLFATDDPGSSLQEWTWRVTPKFVNSAGIPIANFIPPFDIAVPHGEVIDLAQAVKIPQSPGIGTEQIVALASVATDAARSAEEAAQAAAEEASSAGISAYEAMEFAENAETTALSIKKKSDDGDFIPKISVGTVKTITAPAEGEWMANIVQTSPEVNQAFKDIFPTTMKGDKGDMGTGWSPTVSYSTNDANLHTTPGTYYQTSGSTTALNWPIAGKGQLIVSGVVNALQQEFIPTTPVVGVASQTRYLRNQTGSTTWSPWRTYTAQRVATDSNGFRQVFGWDDTTNSEFQINGPGGLVDPVLIDPKIDLNTMTSAGSFCNGVAATAAKNYPVEATAGFLTVRRVNNAHTLIHQEWTPFAHDKGLSLWARGTYMRMMNSNTWSPWRFIPTQRVDNTAGRAIYTWDDTANREQLIYGDTGWRNINALVPTITSGTLHYRRSMYTCELVFENVVLSDAVGSSVALILPNSSATLTGYLPLLSGNLSSPLHIFEYGWSGTHRINKTSASGFKGAVHWTTMSAWPTTLPGTAVGTIPNL